MHPWAVGGESGPLALEASAQKPHRCPPAPPGRQLSMAATRATKARYVTPQEADRRAARMGTMRSTPNALVFNGLVRSQFFHRFRKSTPIFYF